MYSVRVNGTDGVDRIVGSYDTFDDGVPATAHALPHERVGCSVPGSDRSPLAMSPRITFVSSPNPHRRRIPCRAAQPSRPSEGGGQVFA